MSETFVGVGKNTFDAEIEPLTHWIVLRVTANIKDEVVFRVWKGQEKEFLRMMILVCGDRLIEIADVPETLKTALKEME